MVDALAWVMGEQGAKNMRGGAMADVIFAGTAQRQALGRAEVSLTIDNSDGALPIDYREVTISRTMFRSGGSEYAINGTSCRLLDIQELLSDTGMGREMHVIIGQGKLDEVLTSTPEDRRGFVEEAAGLLKHRKRKEKALRKLDSMQGSLTRIEDLTVELRRQMGPLARQADAARKAGLIQAELRDAKARLLADDVAQQLARLGSQNANDQKVSERRIETEKLLEAAKATVDQLEQQVAESRPETAHLASQLEKLGSLEERFRSLGELARERQRSLIQSAGPNYRGEQPRDIRERATRARAEEEQLSAKVNEASDVLARAVSEREALENEEHRATERAAELSRSIADGREQAAKYQGRVTTAQTRIEALGAELQRVEEASASARERSHVAQKEAGEISESLEPNDEEPLAEPKLAELEDARSRRDVLADKQQAKREELAGWKAKEETLALALEPEDATAWALESATESVSLLASYLTVTSGWEAGVEAALLGAASGVLIEDTETAVDFLDQVRQAGAGHLVMMVLDGETDDDRARELNQRAEEAITAAGNPDAIRACDAVEAQENVTRALAPLIAGTVIARDLRIARRLVAAGAPQAVTVAGDLLTPHMMAGGDVSSASILARQKAHEEAVEKAAELGDELDELAGHISQARSVVAALEAENRKIADQAAKLNSEQSARRAKLDLARQKAEAARQELQRNEQRRASLERDLSDRREQLASLQEEGHPRIDPQADANLIQAQKDRADAHEATRVQRQKETDARLALRTAEERLRALAGKSDALERQAQAVEERLERAQRAEVRRKKAAKGTEEVAADAARTLAAVQRIRESRARQRGEVQRRQDELEGQLAGERQKLDRLQRESSQLADERHRSELAAAEQRLRYEQLAERASEELGMDAEELVEEYGPQLLIPTDKGEKPYIREEQEKRLAKSQRAVAKLGKINPLALEEHAALEERQKYLTDQLADLKSSRDDLLGIVKDVDRHVHEVLTQALSDVSDRFTVVFGLLFPGGEGRLVLTDPDDPLTTGIEIEARPPGKRVKRLSLLSGGERSLTAIAFLVAIFMARPSPFYVMDEVEAALDDANLSRLLEIFQQLQRNSQLLLITHQKRTMEIADTLYGITMQDSGVSSVISQRLVDLVPNKEK